MKNQDELWRTEDYDDEPRTDEKSALDLFRDSCEAADTEMKERKNLCEL